MLARLNLEALQFFAHAVEGEKGKATSRRRLIDKRSPMCETIAVSANGADPHEIHGSRIGDLIAAFPATGQEHFAQDWFDTLFVFRRAHEHAVAGIPVGALGLAID